MGETQSSEEECEKNTSESLWFTSLNELKANNATTPQDSKKEVRVFTERAPEFGHIEEKRVKPHSRKHRAAPK